MGKLLSSLFVFLCVVYSYGDDFSKPVSKDLFDIKNIWGSVAISYKADDTNWFTLEEKENNSFSVASTLGAYIKPIHLAFEVAGWSDFGLDIASSPRVNDQIVPNVSSVWHDMTGFEVSQLFFLWKDDKFAIRLGREEISRKISPWLFSDRSISVLDFTYDGLMMAYKSDKSMYHFGWIVNISNIYKTVHLGDKGLGVFFISANTKISKKFKLNNALYIFPNSKYISNSDTFGTGEDIWSYWGDGVYRFRGFADAFQIVYTDGNQDGEHTIALANQLRVFRKKYMFKMTLAYINDGDYSIKTAGFKFGSSAFWGKSLNGEFGADTVKYKQYIARIDTHYKLDSGKIYGGVAYDNYDGEKKWHLDKAYAIQLGYMFKHNGIKYQLEYRYKHQEKISGDIFDKRHIHFDIIYKFIK